MSPRWRTRVTQARRLNALETALYGALLAVARPAMTDFKVDGPLHMADVMLARVALRDIEAMAGAPLPAAVCSRCGSSYPEAFPGSAEAGVGSDCAVRVGACGTVADGGYGSGRHDMTAFRVPPEAGLEPGQVLCDDCVDSLLATGCLSVEQAA